MGVASIRIDQPLHPSAPVGQPGRARDDLVLGDPVIARNSDDTDVIRWVWALVDVPIGSAAVLSSTTAPQVTFTPDIAGSYLLRLMVDDGVDGQIDHKIAAVRDADGFRYPATDEVAAMTNWSGNDEKGWGKDTEEILRGAVGASNLAGVLAVGNTTGANDISIDNGQAIVGAGGGSIGFTAGGDISITPVATATCTGDFVITGKLTVTGLIDPTGLVCDEQVAVPFVAAPGKGTFWVKNTVPCTPMFTGDTGVDATLATTAGTTIAAVLAAGNSVSNGQSIVGQDGGSLSFEAATGVVLSTTLRATILWVAGAESGDGPAAADDFVIGDGSAADFGATVFSGPAAVGGYYMTDTAGTFQGAVRYDHAVDALYLDAGGAARAYIAATGLHPNATGTYDLGLTGTRWRDLWLSRAAYLAGAASGDAPAGSDELGIGDGAGAYGATIFTSNATVGSLLFTDTAGTYQGAVRYDHSTDRIYLDASGSPRFYITSSGLFPNASATYDVGSTSVRPRDLWASRSIYAAGGVSGHDAGADDLSLGDGSAANFGATIFTGNAAIGALQFTDTLGAYQGALRYDHSTDRLYFDAGGAARAYLTSGGLFGNTSATYDFGSTSVRWRDGWMSRALYVAGGVAGHDANVDDFVIGDGSATVFGGTFYSSTASALNFAATLGGTQGGVVYIHSSSSMTLRAGSSDCVDVLSTSLRPSSDNTLDFGTTSRRWVMGWFTGAIDLTVAAATPGAAIAAGRGRHWVKNSAPSRAYFTDDTGLEIDLSGMPTIAMGVGGSRLSTTNPATYGETGGLAPTINFANAATQTAHWWIQIPRNYNGGNLIARLWWTGTTASAVTDVRWRLGFDRAVNARNLAIDNTTLTLFTAAGPSAIDLLKFTDVTLTNANMNSIVAGDMVRVQLSRIGADGADTYTGTAEVIGLQLYL